MGGRFCGLVKIDIGQQYLGLQSPGDPPISVHDWALSDVLELHKGGQNKGGVEK